MKTASLAILSALLAISSGVSPIGAAQPLVEPIKPLPLSLEQDAARSEIGRQLFADGRLSANGRESCSSCHNVAKGGADSRVHSLGFKGAPTAVNAPSVLNAALNFRQFWNGRADSLEAQVDMVVQNPVEMGSKWDDVVAKIAGDAQYQREFASSYKDGVTKGNIQNAIATYERTLITPSRFDRYLRGEVNAISDAEKTGYLKFKQYGCIACHQGVNVGGNMFQKFGVMGDYFAQRGNPTTADMGRYLVTGEEDDKHVFKVPGLRNVALTAPHASSYFENVALLRQLKQLDARWELDVLKSRMGVNSNYDSLVDPLMEINQLQEKLSADIASRHDGDGRLAEAFHRAIDEKTRLIEHFKSHNSVLRNSLAFLPTAAEDLEKALRQAGGDNSTSRDFGSDVNRVLLQTMVFSLEASDDAAAGIRLGLQHLESAKRSLPASVLADSGIFASHVETVLREQPVVNGLLQAIAAVPTAGRLDTIYNLLSEDQRVAEMQSEEERKYLLVFASALAGLLLYAAISLIRSHAVINRVNEELHSANATLEERVKERTRELHEAQSELVATARKAGMAQIANNVLHNVGNVLNSVNVSAELIDTRVRESRVAGLARVAQLLKEHAARLDDFFTRDDRGKALPGYLSKLATALAEERQDIAQEIESLKQSVDHIKEVVATQNTYSGTASVLEAVRVQDLMEDALRMNAASVARRDIAVVKDFAEVPELMLDKHLLLQILVNLISNAGRAMDGIAGPHRLTLRVGLVETPDAPRLRILVEDDGEGIAPENLPRLFVHGFTTRKNGHGFGLHSCALAAKQLAGTITAHSEGPGKGAVFTLDLPVNPAVMELPIAQIS